MTFKLFGPVTITLALVATAFSYATNTHATGKDKTTVLQPSHSEQIKGDSIKGSKLSAEFKLQAPPAGTLAKYQCSGINGYVHWVIALVELRQEIQPVTDAKGRVLKKRQKVQRLHEYVLQDSQLLQKLVRYDWQYLSPLSLAFETQNEEHLSKVIEFGTLRERQRLSVGQTYSGRIETNTRSRQSKIWHKQVVQFEGKVTEVKAMAYQGGSVTAILLDEMLSFSDGTTQRRRTWYAPELKVAMEFGLPLADGSMAPCQLVKIEKVQPAKVSF